MTLPDHSLACARHTARPEIEAMRRKFTVVVEPRLSPRYATAEVIDASGKGRAPR